jgi:hypothetical protein
MFVRTSLETSARMSLETSFTDVSGDFRRQVSGYVRTVSIETFVRTFPSTLKRSSRSRSESLIHDHNLRQRSSIPRHNSRSRGSLPRSRMKVIWGLYEISQAVWRWTPFMCDTASHRRCLLCGVAVSRIP